jgi:hypothetical protein
MDDVLDAMTAGTDLGSSYFLDLETGKVLMVTEKAVTGIDSRPLEEQIEAHPDRYPEIPQVESREEYRWMHEFADHLTEEDIREKLALALAGRGAFGRFRQVLHRYPDLYAQWTTLRQKLLADEAVSWLHGLEVEPIYELRTAEAPRSDPKPPARPKIGLLDLLLLGAPEGKTDRIEGTVLRQVSARSPSEARGLFKELAKDLAAYYGLEWRNRFIEDKDSFQFERAQLRLCGTRVELRVEVADAVWRAFVR